MINYKAIDASKDMVIATSGNIGIGGVLYYINYNRIVSSSASPYTVDTS